MLVNVRICCKEMVIMHCINYMQSTANLKSETFANVLKASTVFTLIRSIPGVLTLVLKAHSPAVHAHINISLHWFSAK